MAKKSILIIEDEKDIQELVKYNLSKEGYPVLAADTGEEGMKVARGEVPGLILLDLMLPGLDGLEVCKILKNDGKTKHIPIVMLTAKGGESDIVTGLELGADDYITKPFSPRVLIARVRALMRREKQDSAGGTDAPIHLHGMVINPGRHEVTVSGESIDLTYTQFRILLLLARRPGWVFTRDQIVNWSRGEDTIVTDRAVDVQIVGLRKKLGDWGKYIETVRGVGYRLQEEA